MLNVSEDVDFLVELSRCPPGTRILDLGCGVGREVRELARRGYYCVGVDISEALIHKATTLAAKEGLSDRVTFKQADFRTFQPKGRFDLVLVWDSTLNIFDLDESESALCRILPLLDPGGVLVHGQLCHNYYRNIDQTFTIENAIVGPGRTRRTYRFNNQSGRLEDHVIYFPPENNEGRSLQVQTLRLYSTAELEAMFKSLNLEDVSIIGSEGWTWALPGRRPPDSNSRMVVAIGRHH